MVKLDQVQNGRLAAIIDFNMRDTTVSIWKNMPDYSLTITMKQTMKLYGRMHPEKFQLHRIQNGRLPAVIYFDISVKKCKFLSYYLSNMTNLK